MKMISDGGRGGSYRNVRGSVKEVAVLGRLRTIAQVPLPAILKALWGYWPYQLLSSPLWASQAHGAYLVCFIFGTQLCPANSRCTTSRLQWLTTETIGLCFSTLSDSLNDQELAAIPMLPSLSVFKPMVRSFIWLTIVLPGRWKWRFSFFFIISILFFSYHSLHVSVFEDGMCGSPGSLVTSLHLISLTFCANPPWMSLTPSFHSCITFRLPPSSAKGQLLGSACSIIHSLALENELSLRRSCS